MPQLNKEELLTQINSVMRLTQLAAIFKELPDHLEGLAIKDRIEIINQAQQQNELLHQKHDIVCMTPDQRDRFIDQYQDAKEYPEKQIIIIFAKKIQCHVRYELIFEFPDGTIEELNAQALKINDYLYTHQDDIDKDYAFNVALIELVGIEMLKEVKKLIASCNIDEIRNLMLTLTQAISIAAMHYQYMCEHALILQTCYNLAIEKFAELSKNTFLRKYVDEVSEPRQVPMAKPTRFMFS